MPAATGLRIAAYAVCHDDAGRMLLARWVGPDRREWTLTGGGLKFGEHPQVGAIRELAEESGYVGEVDTLLGVDAHFTEVDGVLWHSVRIIYRCSIVGGTLTHERDGSTDLAAWVPIEEVATLDAVPLVAAAARLAAAGTGQPVQPLRAPTVRPSAFPRQARVAADALVRDEAGRVLLVRSGPDHPFAGQWFLPGGGVEVGETFDATVRREVAEETGLDVLVVRPRAVTTDVLESRRMQEQVWTVRVIYDARVLGGTLRPEPDRSTDEVRWVAPDELADLVLAQYVREVLGV